MKISLHKVNLSKKSQRTAPCRWIKILPLCFRIQRNRMMFHGLETHANYFLHCWFLAKKSWKECSDSWCWISFWVCAAHKQQKDAGRRNLEGKKKNTFSNIFEATQVKIPHMGSHASRSVLSRQSTQCWIFINAFVTNQMYFHLQV